MSEIEEINLPILFFKVICIIIILVLLGLWVVSYEFNERLDKGHATCWEYRHICDNCFSMNTSEVAERISTCGLGGSGE